MTKSSSRPTNPVKRLSSSMWQQVTTIGIDLGDRMSQCCALSDEGEIVIEMRVATTPAALELAFKDVSPKRIAVETGTHSPWVSRLLTRLGHEVIVPTHASCGSLGADP